jgi:hypothetical protein
VVVSHELVEGVRPGCHPCGRRSRYTWRAMYWW